MDEFSLLSQAYKVVIIIPIIKMRRLSLRDFKICHTSTRGEDRIRAKS